MVRRNCVMVLVYSLIIYINLVRCSEDVSGENLGQVYIW